MVEVLIVLGIGRIVPGVGVGSLGAAVWDAVALTILNAIFAEILRASDDDSYHGTQVRRLAAREFGKPADRRRPGLLMIQIDGLSLPVLEEQMRAGRMPTLDRLVRHGESRRSIRGSRCCRRSRRSARPGSSTATTTTCPASAGSRSGRRR